MKCLLIPVALLMIALSVHVSAQDKNVTPKEQTSNQLYKVTYPNVIFGDQAYAQKLLWLCKYWQDNNIDKIADMLDDNFVGYMPDGTFMKGKPSVVKAFKEMRDAVGTIDMTVNACVVLKSPDVPDRQAVSLWFDETDTAKDGTITKFFSNEVWVFNKQGKLIEARGMVGKYGQ